MFLDYLNQFNDRIEVTKIFNEYGNWYVNLKNISNQ